MQSVKTQSGGGTGGRKARRAAARAKGKGKGKGGGGGGGAKAKAVFTVMSKEDLVGAEETGGGAGSGIEGQPG